MSNKIIQVTDGQGNNVHPVPPVDHILEQGTSGDWEYVKFNSGIFVCWLKAFYAFSRASIFENHGAFHKSIYYPITFVGEPPCCLKSCDAAGAFIFGVWDAWGERLDGIDLYFQSNSTAATINGRVNLLVIGHWR